jgi:signal transduction histidine kinase
VAEITGIGMVGRSTREFHANKDDFVNFGNQVYDKLMKGDSVEKDLVFKRKDGSEFIGHLKMSSYDTSDPAKKAIITISDITWRKKVEEQRIHGEKLKGVIEMAGAVCHELNQPLQAISGYSELLMMDLENDNPLYGQLNTIVGQINRMGELTSKLHKITKYETKDYLEGKIIDIDRSASEPEVAVLSGKITQYKGRI